MSNLKTLQVNEKQYLKLKSQAKKEHLSLWWFIWECYQYKLKGQKQGIKVKGPFYPEARCPICGKKYVKDRKDKTTCGSDNCKTLKSRFKKKIEKTEGYPNLALE